MKLIHLFSSTTEYEDIRTNNYEEPWVSYTLQDKEVNFNKSEEEKKLGTPLTFEIVSPISTYAFSWGGTDATITRFQSYIQSHGGENPLNLQYSYNGGEWTTITTVSRFNVYIDGLKTGDKIQFRGNFPFYCINPGVSSSESIISFDPTTGLTGQSPTVKIYGNIMSLINPTGFANETVLVDGSDETATTANFKNMFIRVKCVDASGLILPATTLTRYCYGFMFGGGQALFTQAPELPATTLVDSCYHRMFDSCRNLTTAPELPATTLADNCYDRMFQNCTNLNYIKCLATNISATACTNNWVSGVQTNSGTFIKAPSMNDWTTGNNGVPTGWTVQDAN